ncbi:Nuclear factor of activated T-cells 1 like [Actinidia chinensis var. chinensis]|uniref:Nuclear factor of activated T-cells 1 like n=1 Tax=Actinidia chinensis var. chinensis TaxID=1590841 RepID=A0A2R6Q7E1_ACTCC|nr:Nuclear factor of activated T-cells 1 like [Actinidia chinensis var. chinensis]
MDDFEFRLEDPVTMLPADELFSEGKLVPLQISMIRPAAMSAVSSENSSPKTRRIAEISVADPYLFSPKAPRCSSRWKEILGLKKLYLNNNAKQDSHETAASSACNNSKSLKKFLHRSSKSSDSSLSLPLLKDSDSESLSISSSLSLSSSSSGHELDDLPSLSLDSDKPNMSQNPLFLSKTPNLNSNPSRVRLVKKKAVSSEYPTGARGCRTPMRRAPDSTTGTARGVSVDSPRMNSSGKIVFQGLERSSSSPSSFHGGPRFKHRGMERSYSANVRVTPVLNVPICSLRGSSKSGVFGFPLFSTKQNRGGNRGQLSNNSRNRTDRA